MENYFQPSFLLTFSVVATIFVSFACSLLEAVILSLPQTFVAIGVEKGKKSALIMEKLKQEIDRPLAAILTVNTVAATIGAASVAIQIERVFGNHFVAIGSAVFTVTILVFSEILPKTLGVTHAQSLSTVSSYTIQFLIYVTYPFVIFSEKFADIISAGKPHKISREEMLMTATLGAEQGSLDKKELSIIKNLFLLQKMYVSDIMTPRSVLLAFDKEWTVGEVIKRYTPIRFSRIPVYSRDLDSIEGLVLRYKILEASSNDQHNRKLSELMAPISSIYENETVAKALDSFIKTKSHIFIVLDEYGTTTGIVTLEDAIETLLGVEIVDEFDSVADLRQYALEQWQLRKNKIRRIE